MEENIKKIELGVRKYLSLRKVLRIIEICLSALIMAFLFANKMGLIEFSCFLFAAFAIPESILAIKRSILKLNINNEKLIVKTGILFCSEMISDYETMKNEIIFNGSKKKLSEECKQLIWKEKVGTGWISNKIEYLKKSREESKQRIEILESIKKRLVIF